MSYLNFKNTQVVFLKMARFAKPLLNSFCRPTPVILARYNHSSTFYFQQPFKQNVLFTLPLLFSRGLDKRFEKKIAFTDYSGNNFTFGELTSKSILLAKEIQEIVPDPQERVAFLCERDATFVATLGATWWLQQIGNGGKKINLNDPARKLYSYLFDNVAIPLSAAHPDSMLEYFLQSTSTKLIITSKKYADRLNRIAKLVNSQILAIDDIFWEKRHTISNQQHLQSLPTNCSTSHYENKGSVILFTSGTTGKPKGVLLTHGNLKAQAENISGAWQVSEKDTMLHVLPLHHTHGLIHALLSPMAGGARCHMLEKFDPKQTWQEFLSREESRTTMFTAVPTVYVKLIEQYDKTFAKDPTQISRVRQICSEKMRLFLSGSASLPVPILEKFEAITGHRILERYGMTETGLILCNPVDGERKPGFVGTPLQTVKIVVADLEKSGAQIVATGGAKKFTVLNGNHANEGQVVGDLLVKGPSVFKEYWGNQEATANEFTKDGWFKTGDTVEFNGDSFKILGRKSVDIIKSGGYKLSALEIETQLLALPEVKEVAVLGIPDAVWGQKVAAVIVWTEKELSVKELRQLAKTRIASYACPQVVKSLPEMPRNHLGKVNKKELIKLFS